MMDAVHYGLGSLQSWNLNGSNIVDLTGECRECSLFSGATAPLDIFPRRVLYSVKVT